MNKEALEIALTIALIVEAKPVNETHVMRKMVIDGSTPFGFQRTAVVALDGKIEVEGKKIPIQTICVEEDACRKIKEKGATVYYRLDRLGAPLVEVVTSPVIYSPEEAEKIALTLGQILRSTGRVRRGIGTIRQDLNISIAGGAISEIKGVQKIELVSKVIDYEIQRQLKLLEICEELRKRGVKEDNLRSEIRDVSIIFHTTKCRVIRNALNSGGSVKAIVLARLSGLLCQELIPGIRFGTELSDQAKFWGRVEGIFHSDELPAYGISDEEIEKLRVFLKMNEEDAFVLVANYEENAIDALRAVLERVKSATIGIPNETRSAYQDGTTHFSRPRPGAARMYPETDVSPVSITDELLGRLRKNLPEPPDVKLSRLMENYHLNKKLATQLLNSDYCNVFETVANETKVSTSFIAAMLTETFKDMDRKGIDVGLLSEGLIKDVFSLVDHGKVAKEAIPEIFNWIIEHEEEKLDNIVEMLGLKMIHSSDLKRIVEKVVEENENIIRERGISALSPLMGIVMKELRGKTDAKEVSQLLKIKIEEKLRR